MAKRSYDISLKENKYEIQLNNLIDLYGLEYTEMCDSNLVHNTLMELFKTRCEGKKVALWGAGRKNAENSHAAIILKKYTTYIQGMSVIIDSMPELWGDEFLGYPIISPEEIVQNDIDIVIVASKVQSDSIINDLGKYAPDCKCIDIYGELKRKGFNIYHKFYDESNIYTSVYQLRKGYEEAQGIKKGNILKEIISAYLSIRDFYYAKKFAKEYISNKYENYSRIEEFLQELEKLELEIKEKNRAKKDDIVIFFVDSLRKMDVFHKSPNGYEADMLKSYLDKAIVFTNAKSTGVTTYESMISVIKGKYPYDQNVYENNIMADFDEFSLLPLVKSKGYNINFYVSEGYQVIKDDDGINFVKQVYLPSKLWKLQTDMACSEEKTFNFIYVPYELHFPLICGFHEKEPIASGFVDVGIKDTSDYVPRQLAECKHYVNYIFNYYESWFSEDILFALFSDHSQVVYDDKEQKPYFMYYNNQDRCVNITFFIKGRGLQHQWNEELVSMIDFCKIIEQIINNNSLEIPKREVAIYQYYKIHYKKLREYAQSHGLEDYIDGIWCFTDNDYLFVKTATGKEELICLNEKVNKEQNNNLMFLFEQSVKQKYIIDFNFKK